MTALVVAPMVVGTAAAYAQEASPVAEALYREGKRLIEANRVAEACIKFAESQRVEPATGTLLNLANCHEKEGKTATAWAEFTQVAGTADLKGQTRRAAFAHEHADALEKNLHSLVVDVKRPSAGMVDANPSDGGNGYKWRLVLATRDDRSKTFGAPQPLAAPLNGYFSQRHPTLNRDETTIVFATGADASTGVGYEYLYFASRADASSAFGPPQRLPPIVNSEVRELDPFIHTYPDGGQELWFAHSESVGTSILHWTPIANADLGAPDAFATPKSLGGDFVQGINVTPVVSEDGLELFFSRGSGPSEISIWTARRTTPNEPFGKPEPVNSLNTDQADRPGWLSPDRCRLYFLSSRANPTTDGRLNIYVAERRPK